MELFNLEFYCSKCGERLEIEDIDELYSRVYILPCENCLSEQEEQYERY